MSTMGFEGRTTGVTKETWYFICFLILFLRRSSSNPENCNLDVIILVFVPLLLKGTVHLKINNLS